MLNLTRAATVRKLLMKYGDLKPEKCSGRACDYLTMTEVLLFIAYDRVGIQRKSHTTVNLTRAGNSCLLRSQHHRDADHLPLGA